jgi:crotonobetainyl-CoA:carnitine CoA-transferase CaiB-like acyl-CoA transferase
VAGSLDGLRVLDLSRFIAGPHCAMLLGDHGADVIKVERTGSGDDVRQLQPQVNGQSVYFMVFNRNKRGITLDFRQEPAQRLLRELAAQADVLIENFRPGTMEKMGCGWDELHRLNPRLVMARVSGFGQTGPLASQPCFDAIAQAMSGLMEITGDPGGPPTMAGTFVVDYCTALYATTGILMALQRRHVAGGGQLVDVSLLDSAVSLLMTAIPEQILLNRPTTRLGNRDRYASPGNTFRTRDGDWVHFIAGSEAHFPRLVRAMRREELLQAPAFATVKARLANTADIEAIVAEWAGGLSTAELLDALQRAEIPGAKVAGIAEVIENPQLRHRRQIETVQHPAAGAFPSQGVTVQMSDAPGSVRRPAPLLGEHTDEVLRQWLDYTPERIAALRAEGTI